MVIGDKILVQTILIQLDEEGKIMLEPKKNNWNKDQENMESSNYRVPHQMEKPTNRRFDMGRWVIPKEACIKKIKCWGLWLFKGHGHLNP